MDSWKAIGLELAKQKCMMLYDPGRNGLLGCEWKDQERKRGGTCPVCRARALRAKTRKKKGGGR